MAYGVVIKERPLRGRSRGALLVPAPDEPGPLTIFVKPGLRADERASALRHEFGHVRIYQRHGRSHLAHLLQFLWDFT